MNIYELYEIYEYCDIVYCFVLYISYISHISTCSICSMFFRYIYVLNVFDVFFMMIYKDYKDCICLIVFDCPFALLHIFHLHPLPLFCPVLKHFSHMLQLFLTCFHKYNMINM